MAAVCPTGGSAPAQHDTREFKPKPDPLPSCVGHSFCMPIRILGKNSPTLSGLDMRDMLKTVGTDMSITRSSKKR